MGLLDAGLCFYGRLEAKGDANHAESGKSVMNMPSWWQAAVNLKRIRSETKFMLLFMQQMMNSCLSLLPLITLRPESHNVMM